VQLDQIPERFERKQLRKARNRVVSTRNSMHLEMLQREPRWGYMVRSNALKAKLLRAGLAMVLYGRDRDSWLCSVPCESPTSSQCLRRPGSR
jgi:hypothetical protein